MCAQNRVNKGVKSSIPAYLDVNPLHDYEPVGHAGDSSVDLYRDTAIRQMVYIQQVIQEGTAKTSITLTVIVDRLGAIRGQEPRLNGLLNLRNRVMIPKF